MTTLDRPCHLGGVADERSPNNAASPNLSSGLSTVNGEVHIGNLRYVEAPKSQTLVRDVTVNVVANLIAGAVIYLAAVAFGYLDFVVVAVALAAALVVGALVGVLHLRRLLDQRRKAKARAADASSVPETARVDPALDKPPTERVEGRDARQRLSN